MPVGSTSQRSVQVSGFGDYGHLTPLRRLIRFLFVRPAFCLGLPSDSQSPATPLPSANTSPCRVCRGLSPPSRQAHHHSEPDSASHGATRHAWRTIKKATRRSPKVTRSRCDQWATAPLAPRPVCERTNCGRKRARSSAAEVDLSVIEKNQIPINATAMENSAGYS